MNTKNKNTKNIVFQTVKYVLGILGFIGVLIAIFIVVPATSSLIIDFLIKIGFKGTFNATDQLIISLSSSVLGILFLFIAFSKQIDKFFSTIETKELKISKKEEKKGISLEFMLFLIIAILLITLAILMGIGYLTIRTELPLLGKATKGVLITSLIILSLLALITAFNDLISRSLKEMKKVTWPSGKQMIDYSIKVFTFIFFFSLLFLALDLIIGNAPVLVERIINWRF